MMIMKPNITYYRMKEMELIHLKDKAMNYKEHNHVSTYTLGFVLNGSVTLVRDNKMQIYNTNSYFMIPPYQIHALILPENYEILSVSIHKSVISMYNENLCDDSPLSDCINYLWSNPEASDSMQYWANKVHFSRAHFFNLFRQTIGMSPHKFQIQNRIRKAQRLIEDNVELTTIAVSLGFYDQSHFIKCFKNILGLTPLEYKQSVKILE